MDQTFNFRAAPLPMRRRLSPRVMALVATAVVVLAGFGSFSRWVIDSERRSDERAARAETSTSIIGTMPGGDDELMAASPVADRLAIDGTAKADARTALGAAQRAASGRATFLDAGPGHLTPLESELIFVDGPSQAPGVVSVASTTDSWGAAVMGASGTCYLLRFAPGEGVSYDIGATPTSCTGEEALAARASSW